MPILFVGYFSLTKSPTFIYHLSLHRCHQYPATGVFNKVDYEHITKASPFSFLCHHCQVSFMFPVVVSHSYQVTYFHLQPFRCFCFRVYLLLSLCFPAPLRWKALTASQFLVLIFIANLEHIKHLSGCGHFVKKKVEKSSYNRFYLLYAHA